MTNKLKNLLRKVFLGSLAGIAASNTSSANTNMTVFEPAETDNKFESILNREPDLSPKLVLKKKTNVDWAFMSHRSHRSHQSHRSHYSSQGSGHVSHFSHYSSSAGGATSYPNTGKKSNNSSPDFGSSNNYLSLGYRNLSLGKFGTDVTELINILIKKGYLSTKNGSSYVTGIYEYDSTIQDAIKRFQQNNGLQANGICGPTTIYYLKNK